MIASVAFSSRYREECFDLVGCAEIVEAVVLQDGNACDICLPAWP